MKTKMKDYSSLTLLLSFLYGCTSVQGGVIQLTKDNIDTLVEGKNIFVKVRTNAWCSSIMIDGSDSFFACNCVYVCVSQP